LRSKTVTIQLPDGCIVVATFIQARGVSDRAFHDTIRRAESDLRALGESSAAPAQEPAPADAEPRESAGNGEASEALKIPPSSRKLYVGNLPFDWTEEPLKAFFAETGTVTAAVIARYRGRGRSRGFGFVEMSTESEAQAAIEKLHGAEAGG